MELGQLLTETQNKIGSLILCMDDQWRPSINDILSESNSLLYNLCIKAYEQGKLDYKYKKAED